jgi:hypothetical protein
MRQEKNIGNWIWLHNEEIRGWYVLVDIVMKSRANGFETKA